MTMTTQFHVTTRDIQGVDRCIRGKIIAVSTDFGVSLEVYIPRKKKETSAEQSQKELHAVSLLVNQIKGRVLEFRKWRYDLSRYANSL